jgi:mono/diheme cytochrome c family protein/thiol-disulfide isomerase/thioredoxin
MNARPKQILGSVAVALAMLGLTALAARAIRGRVEGAARPEVLSAPTVPPPAPSGRGRLLYQVQCVRCHGPEGRGDGPDSPDLRPPPRDFASGRWKLGPGPEAIRKAIVEGIPGTAMYATGATNSPRDLDALVEHVRALAAAGLAANLKLAGFEPAISAGLAPGFEVEDLDGTRHRLEFGPSTKVTLLVFWGTLCPPCLNEMPALARLAGATAGLDVVPVCVDDSDRAEVASALNGRFDRTPSYLSEDPMARVRYDLQTLPVAALVGRRGELLGIARGAVDWESEAARRLVEGLVDGPLATNR